jgi:hypothetical protein
MTLSATMPSLSTDGWVNSSLKTADYLFSHFFASDYSQTYVFPGQIASFAYILHSNQGNIQGTMTALRQTLSTYFSKYYKDVIVEVDDSPTVSGSSFIALNIFMNFTDDKGVIHSLGKMIEYTNTTVNKVVTLNNGQ